MLQIIHNTYLANDQFTVDDRATSTEDKETLDTYQAPLNAPVHAGIAFSETPANSSS